MMFLIVFLALFVAAGVLAVLTNRPSTYDRNWSVGAMIDPSRR